MNFPYGCWDSWVKEESFANPPTAFQDIGASSTGVFWTESRPSEKGRNALMCFDPVLGFQEKFPFANIQSGLHEYGGGAFAVFGQIIVFFDREESVLYMENQQKELVTLVQDPLKRFADFTLSPDESMIVAVCEDHSNPEEVENYLVAIDVATKKMQILERQDPFYASPQFSPDGKKIAFLSWNFPNMPWQECHLTVADFQEGLKNKRRLGEIQESICQYVWLDSEEILLSSDKTGFWNLYSWSKGSFHLLYQKNVDFGAPLWTLGKKLFAPFIWNGKKAILCMFTEKAVDHLAILSEGALVDLDSPYTAIKTLSLQNDHRAYFIGGSPLEPLSLIELDLQTCTVKVIKEGFSLKGYEQDWICLPESVSVQSSIDNESVFGFYYPPKNPFFVANTQDRPPLIIRCHGGPTAHISPVFNLDVQFWTSRGFGWLDVNYRGSSGFGRKYREALNQKWGELDVQDCLDLANELVQKKNINPNGIFARGSSSGGLTALSLATKQCLQGCVSLYGVTDLVALAADTHKFERYYLETLIGSRQECISRYEQRSPLWFFDQIRCPVLFLHGAKDRVVPLSQAQELASRLSSSKLIIFPGEGHGFKQADTLQSCLERELAFYLHRLGLSLKTDL